MNFKLDANSLPKLSKEKWLLFGHACRNNKCNLVKTYILGMMSGKRRRGRPRMQYGPTLIASRNGQGHPWKKT